MQLHYCHKKFLDASALPECPDEEVIEEDFDDENKDSEEMEAINETKEPWTKKISAVATKFYKMMLHFAEIVVLYVEIHACKILFVSFFYLATKNTELLHLIFVILGVVGLGVKTNTQLKVTRIASLITVILVVSKMVYHLDDIDSSKFEANCGNKSDSTIQVTSNAVWMGFTKTDNAGIFIDIVRSYLIYIVLVTIHSFIILKQKIKRIKKNLPQETPSLVFENVHRFEADKDIAHLFKYLMNYGFYKFGIEISLICLVLVIGYRMDLIACFYSTWLLVLFKFKREKVWIYATYTIAASIIIQYVLLIGLPPSFCRSYPWQQIEFLNSFTTFAFLPENTVEFKNKSKLLFLDFILLLFMSLQIKVFKIEARHKNLEVQYPGGTNESIINDIEILGNASFVAESNDFTGKTRNFLDILKRLVFSWFFWITLAVTFWTGTSNGNIFSIGYIIGSFFFLWQGIDFYLKPIKTIIKWWNCLMAYNVSVIVIKCIIQLVGCIVLNFENINSFCWLIKVGFALSICSNWYKNLFI